MNDTLGNPSRSPGAETNHAHGSEGWPPFIPFEHRRMKARDNPRSKFVILATSRSGTNYLLSLLRSHPEIECFGELASQIWPPKNFRPEILQNPVLFKLRRQFPAAFISVLLTLYRKKKAVGFKLLRGQNDTVERLVVGSPNTVKIILYRENILASHSSLLLADATGIYTSRDPAFPKTEQVHFDANRFERYQSAVVSYYSRLRQQVANNSTPFIAYPYRELSSAEGHRSLLEELGVRADEKLHSTLRKQNTGSIESRFENIEEVREYCAARNCLQWLESG